MIFIQLYFCGISKVRNVFEIKRKVRRNISLFYCSNYINSCIACTLNSTIIIVSGIVPLRERSRSLIYLY